MKNAQKSGVTPTKAPCEEDTRQTPSDVTGKMRKIRKGVKEAFWIVRSQFLDGSNWEALDSMARGEQPGWSRPRTRGSYSTRSYENFSFSSFPFSLKTHSCAK